VQNKEHSKLSNIFSLLDEHFIQAHQERKELLRSYKDMPVPAEKLYKEPNYILNKHGKDLQVMVDPYNQSKRRKRRVEVIKETYDDTEESMFNRMHASFSKLSEQYGKTEMEISQIFMSVSGDFERTKKVLEGEQVVQWSQMDDNALSMPTHTAEYKALLAEKGEAEIDIRLKFMTCKQLAAAG